MGSGLSLSEARREAVGGRGGAADGVVAPREAMAVGVERWIVAVKSNHERGRGSVARSRWVHGAECVGVLASRAR